MPNDDEGWGEPVSGGDIWDLDTEGPLVGVYQGYEIVKSEYGDSRLHAFVTDKGVNKVWGKTHLNRLLENRNGELVKIKLTGNKIDIPGRNPMYEYACYSKGRPTEPPPFPGEPG